MLHMLRISCRLLIVFKALISYSIAFFQRVMDFIFTVLVSTVLFPMVYVSFPLAFRLYSHISRDFSIAEFTIYTEVLQLK